MPDESESILSRQISTVRHFNRFYTRAIGTLQSHLLGSPFTLAEARVLYELFHSQHSTATQIARELNMDAGYLTQHFLRHGRALLERASRKASTQAARRRIERHLLSIRIDPNRVEQTGGGLPRSNRRELALR